jgi:RNA polymerase sigma-70 factor, ECF subfamily
MMVKPTRDAWPDEELMVAYGRGDEAAFRTLYERHKGWLYRVLLRQCGDAAAADEVFQETWLTLIRTAPSYEPRAKLTTWLYQLARQRLIDRWRGQKPETPFSALYGEEDSDHEPLDDVADWRATPEDTVERQRFLAELIRAVEKLPAEQREAFLLWAEAGLTAEEIALAMSTTMETAKSRLRYARNRLKSQLQHYAPDSFEPT